MRKSPLYFTSILLAILGLLDSLYLSWIKLTHQEALCSNIGDCETVNNSVYSEIGGIPIALLGAGAYLAILAVLLLESRNAFWRDNGVFIVFGLSLVGVLYSGYLTYIEIAVLQAICPFCVVSAVVLVLLLILSVVRLLKEPVGIP
jgi:uncharacterized membrane protein